MKNKDIYQQVFLDVWDKTTNSNNLWRQINARVNSEIVVQVRIQIFDQLRNQLWNQIHLIKEQMHEQ